MDVSPVSSLVNEMLLCNAAKIMWPNDADVVFWIND